MLKKIANDSIHKICSGQVVLTLAVAVKELIENSIDAGANTIEVRLKDCGTELIEVIDNGSGIKAENYQTLTLKHFTSKISEFSDVATVETFGFRGEALSSLCSLSNLVVVTCHSDQSVASRIQYDNNGVIKTITNCAREPGTTVILSNLFYTLPVRQKEFNRNIKKEFGRLVRMLQGYCLISLNTKITCYNQIGNGYIIRRGTVEPDEQNKRQVVMSTVASNQMIDCISCLFGPKQVNQVVPIVQCPSEQGESPLSATPQNLFKINGYISKCCHGYGRSTTDRQFFFFNGRPCDHNKLSKTVNEVYHAYNRHQYPFVCLNIITDRDIVDVNLTPDKRMILVHEEKLLLTLIKESLINMFDPMQGMVESNNPSPFIPFTPTTPSNHISTFIPATPSNHTSTFIPATPFNHASAPFIPATPSNHASVPFIPATPSNHASAPFIPATPSNHISTFIPATPSNHASAPFVPATPSDSDSSSTIISNAATPNPTTPIIPTLQSNHNDGSHGDTPLPFKLLKSFSYSLSKGNAKQPRITDFGISKATPTHHCSSNKSTKSKLSVRPTTICQPRMEQLVEGVVSQGDDSVVKENISPLPVNQGGSGLIEDTPPVDVATNKKIVYDIERCPFTDQVYCDTINVNIELMRERQRHSCEDTSCHDNNKKYFHAKIEPEGNTQAEDELKRELNKENFKNMQVLGQFNLGFIIAKLDSNLFIIDQHATDEKYNYERLQRDTVIEHQTLIRPLPLELTVIGESVIIENEEIFARNGFRFRIDETAPPTKRVKLIGQPVSKKWSMGVPEIEELIFLLMDYPGEMMRPSCVNKMFAMRACRGSIMIGTPLNGQEMKKLLGHMSEMNQPWNCPHGRPTLRHLIDLSRLDTS